MAESDETMLRRAFAVARRALAHGNHPFGALLAGPAGEVLLESENGYMPSATRPRMAERLLATAASKTYRPEGTRALHMYGVGRALRDVRGAIYWSGIGRVVYALSRSASRRSPATTPRTRPSTCPAANRVRGRPTQGRGSRAAVGGRGRRAA